MPSIRNRRPVVFPFCALTAYRYRDKGLGAGASPLTFEPLGVALPEDTLLINWVENFMARKGEQSMISDPLSLILLPTLRCNARCDYCFENKKESDLSPEQFSVILKKILDHMDENNIAELNIHWQGGEVMTLPPEWFSRAHEIIQETSEKRNKEVKNHIQIRD